MTQLEQDKKIEELEAEILALKGKKKDKSKAFSDVTNKYLKKLKIVKENFSGNKFNDWFNNDYNLLDEEIIFLSTLLNKFIDILPRLKEESLKVLFISQILNKIDFFSMEYRYIGLYDEPLRYENENFIFNGEADFIFAKGISRSEKPYFFIQEFKQEKGATEPEYQLLAELISAVELNNQNMIKGAYIKGTIWRFVILEKLEKDKYQYFVSQNFDSTKIEDLKDIFKNLLFVKNEIIKIIQQNKG